MTSPRSLVQRLLPVALLVASLLLAAVLVIRSPRRVNAGKPLGEQPTLERTQPVTD